MRIKISRLIWLLWASLVVLEPITTRTPADGLCGGSLGYTLWTDFLFGFVVLAMIIRQELPVIKIPRRLRIGRVQFAFLLLLVLHYMSVFISGLAGDSMMTYILSGSVWVQALLAFVAAQRMVKTEANAIQLRHFFFAGYCIVALIGFLEIARAPAVVNFLDLHYGTAHHVKAAKHLADIGQFRITSTFDRNPHGLALYVMMAVTWLTAILVVRRGQPGGKLIPILLIGVGLTLLMGTFSTLGMAATAISVISVVLSRRRNRLTTALVMILLLMFGIYLVASHLPSDAMTDFVAMYRMLTVGDRGPSSLMDRLDVWAQIWRYTCQSPSNLLFGVPYSTVKHANDDQGIGSDSDYMFMLLYKGLAGLFAFLLLYWFILDGINRALRRLPKGNFEHEVLLLTARGILLGMMVAGFAGGFMSGGGTAWRTAFMAYTLIGAAFGIRKLRGSK